MSNGVWFISVHDHAPVTGDRLRRRIEQLIATVVNQQVSTDQSRRLIALPVLGIGGGGQDHDRGAVVRLLVEELHAHAHRFGVDIALVTNDRSVYTAAKHFRREYATIYWHLGDEAMQTAHQLGDHARTGQLALFLGAGVSMSAGLPGWKDLLKELGDEAGIDDATLATLSDSPLDQAELISQELGDRLGHLVHKITSRADRISLAHALLAGIHCREAVTTNYDTLYEEAVESAGRPRPTLVPWQPVEGNRPWLLKMHGDVHDPKTIVLTRRALSATTRTCGLQVRYCRP